LRWFTRTRGSKRQIGKRFPVVEKKKLPQRFSIPRPRARPPLSISNVTYEPATQEKDGFISFRLNGANISNKIKIADTARVGQFDLFTPTVYVHSNIPSKYQKALAQHESLEAYFRKRFGLNEEAEGHILAEDIERREFLKSRSLSDWMTYEKTVKFASRLGGKYRPAALRKAYEVLRIAMAKKD